MTLLLPSSTSLSNWEDLYKLCADTACGSALADVLEDRPGTQAKLSKY